MHQSISPAHLYDADVGRSGRLLLAVEGCGIHPLRPCSLRGRLLGTARDGREVVPWSLVLNLIDELAAVLPYLKARPPRAKRDLTLERKLRRRPARPATAHGV